VVFLLVALCVSVSTATAVPLDQYHKTVEHVIQDLQSLLKQGDDETGTQYDSRFTATLDEIRSELPPKLAVEMGGETCVVDNLWLHYGLKELQLAEPEKQAGMIEKFVESLQAIDARVNDFENATEVPYDKNAANERLKGILARPEYVTGARGQNALARVIQDFMRWLRSLLPKPRQMEPGRADYLSLILQYLVIGVAVLLILYVLRLLLIRYKRTGGKKIREKREPRIVLGERLAPEETASDLLSEAEALARNGDLRGAIRKGYIALLVELGDRKLISLAQYKTNRDYLRSVSSRPQLHSRMKGLTESFERHWYGFAQVTPTDWQDFRTGYREALQSGN